MLKRETHGERQCYEAGCRCDACVKANSDRCKRYYEKNAEREVERAARWAKANPEKKAASDKKWREARKEEQAAYFRRYYLDNKDKKARQAEEWKKANPERVQGYRAARRNREDDAVVELFPPSEVFAPSAEFPWFGPVCGWCGKSSAVQVDHLRPIQPRPGESAGLHERANAAPSCETCNKRKSNRQPEAFAATLRSEGLSEGPLVEMFLVGLRT